MSNPHAHAVIISGGYTPPNNYKRYWGDVAFLYYTLKNVRGYLPENIHVFMSDGSGSAILDKNDGTVAAPEYVDSSADFCGDGVLVSYQSATRQNIMNKFIALYQQLDENDELLVAVTDHGGYRTTNGIMWAASPMSIYGGGDDQMNAIHTHTTMPDENLISDYLIYCWGGSMTDTDLFMFTSAIKCPVMFVMEQCFSGGFIPRLMATPNRAICTACPADAPSISGPTYPNYDFWIYYFTAALAGWYPAGALPWVQGAACNADGNGDGIVSFAEAAQYADTMVRAISFDLPQYSENPVGIGSTLLLSKPSVTITLNSAGWNVVSLPVEPIDGDPKVVFGDGLLACYEWNAGEGRYQLATAISACKGYLVAVNTTTTRTISGDLRASSHLSVVPGWNLVGPRETAVAPFNTWEYINDAYALVAQCVSGKGYWVHSKVTGTIW